MNYELKKIVSFFKDYCFAVVERGGKVGETETAS